jgi:hypothetical protein
MNMVAELCMNAFASTSECYVWVGLSVWVNLVHAYDRNEKKKSKHKLTCRVNERYSASRSSYKYDGLAQQAVFCKISNMS